jgi:hypothetical protein
MIRDVPGFIKKIIDLNNAYAVKGAAKEFEWAPALLADYCEDTASDPYGWGWCGALYFDDGTALVLYQNELGQWRMSATSHDMAREEVAEIRQIYENEYSEA